MKITNKLIEEVVSTVAGEDTVPLILAIKDKKNISEFKIADMLKEQINITRNMLYRLLDQDLVHFIRKKDRIKGWYIYYWTFNPRQIKYLTVKLQKERLFKLRERLERENSALFFACPEGCIRLDFEQAMNFEFKCPECGSIIQQQDNSEEIKKLKSKIIDVESFLKSEVEPLIPIRKASTERIMAKTAKTHIKKKTFAKKLAKKISKVAVKRKVPVKKLVKSVKAKIKGKKK
jgi:transcription initiation factor TFIIE subunit alpha